MVVFVLDKLENLVPFGGPDVPELPVFLGADLVPGFVVPVVGFLVLSLINNALLSAKFLVSIFFLGAAVPPVVPKGVTLIGPTISG